MPQANLNIKIKKDLHLNGVREMSLTHLLRYTKEGTFDQLRLDAFSCLLDIAGLRNGTVLRYILQVLSTDQSPFIRRQLLELFQKALGNFAINGDPEDHAQDHAQDNGELIMHETFNHPEQARGDKNTARQLIAALKLAFKDSESMAKSLWEATIARETGLFEISELLGLCAMMYEPKTSLMVHLKLPDKVWSVKNHGQVYTHLLSPLFRC